MDNLILITGLTIILILIIIVLIKQKQGFALFQKNEDEFMKQKNTIIELIEKNQKNITTGLENFEKVKDVLIIDSKALAMKMNILQNAITINAETTLDINTPKWLVSKGDVKKYFIPGKIEKVINNKDNSETIFESKDNGEVLSKTFVNGRLKYEIIHTVYGNPISGTTYNEDGNIREEYTYDKLGQVTKNKKEI